MFTLHLDQQIRQKLGLFQGLRSQEADEKLYMEAYERLFDEMLRFVADNAPHSAIRKGMQTPPGETFEETWANKFVALKGFLSEIPNWELRLYQRLTHYLNNWVVSAH